jgi:putative membrane protein
MELKYKNFKEVLINIIVGIFIGLSVIVPGISGSTMAITLKVYDKGMYAFSHMFKEFKKCFIYALPVIGGIFVGFFGAVKGLQFLLDTIPFITICLFMGLMIGTYPVIFKEVKGEKPNTKNVLLTIAGFIVPIVFSVLSLVLVDGQNTLENLNFGHYVLFFVMGALISVTQLLPGLSATVLMMIFGYYSALMGGLHFSLLTDFPKLLVYILMGIGFLVGVFTISKLFEKILNKARRQFFFVVSGISVGSVISVFIGKDCMEIYKNWTFPMIVIELVLGVIALAGAFTVSFILTRYNEKRERESTEKNN